MRGVAGGAHLCELAAEPSLIQANEYPPRYWHRLVIAEGKGGAVKPTCFKGSTVLITGLVSIKQFQAGRKYKQSSIDDKAFNDKSAGFV